MHLYEILMILIQLCKSHYVPFTWKVSVAYKKTWKAEKIITFYYKHETPFAHDDKFNFCFTLSNLQINFI